MRADHPLKGMAWMVTGVRLLSVMDALSKHAVSQLSILVLIAARSVMVLVLLVPLVLLMAVLVLLGQRCTFRAFQLAPVGVVAPFHYSELLWAALFGSTTPVPSSVSPACTAVTFEASGHSLEIRKRSNP